MQNTGWAFAFASVIGNGHIKESLPCQDACRVENFDDFIIAVVSDGAGSCANSHVGSCRAVEYSIYHFKKLIHSQKWNKQALLPSKDTWQDKAKETLYDIKTDIENYALNNDYEFKSLSCTIIVTIVLRNGLLVTHIGDGRAGYCTTTGEWKSSIRPFHGELANQTVFITSDIWDDGNIDTYIESTIVDAEVKAICLLSDGCEKASYECNLYNETIEKYYDPNIPYPLFFNPNIEILPKMLKEGKSQDEINIAWEKFLTNGTEKLKNETDDKTLIIGVRLSD